MVPLRSRIPQKKLRTTIQFSCAVMLTGCASSIDASKDVQAANQLAQEHLPIVVDETMAWNEGEPLSAEAAIAYALMHDALLQRDLAVIVQRRAEIAQAELPANPTFTGAFGIAVDGLAGAPLILQGVQNLSWLWTRPDRIASAEQTLQQAILTSANRAVEVVANVRIAHHEAVTKLELVRLSKEDSELAKEILAVTKEHASVGEAPESDVDKANIVFLETQHTLRDFEEQFKYAKLNLLHAMGCPETQTVSLFTKQQTSELLSYAEEDIFLYAIENRLDLATQRAIIEQRFAELGLANPPLISGSAMFNENFTDRQAILPGGGITIALDGDAKDAAADSKLKQAELQYIDSMRTVVLDVRTLFESYTASLEKFQIDEKVLHTAEISLQRAFDASKQGELNPLSLLPIQRGVIQAKQHLVQDVLLINTNTIKLERAVGGSFKGMNK